MIRHIVLLNFQDNLSEEKIAGAFSALGNLQNTIAEIRHFSYGPCNSPENLHKGFLHGFVMEFENENDRDIYLKHPKHIQVAQEELLPLLKNYLDSVVVFDYSL